MTQYLRRVLGHTPLLTPARSGALAAGRGPVNRRSGLMAEKSKKVTKRRDASPPQATSALTRVHEATPGDK